MDIDLFLRYRNSYGSTATIREGRNGGIVQNVRSLEPMGILFIIFYLHYMLYMFTPTLYAFSQPLYHVCADFAQHIGIDNSTTL
jgi:hypothetical protein